MGEFCVRTHIPIFLIPRLTIIKIQVPLSAPSAATLDMALPVGGLGALPATHLTPRTLIGAGGEGRETMGHLYASQIASHLALRDPNDKRTLLLGLGIEKADATGDAFFDLLELVVQVL
jgi:proteasome assembly chaperone 3